MYNNRAKLALSHRNITSWAIWIYVMKILTKVPVADLGEGRPYFLLFMLAQGMDPPQSMFGSTK